VTPPGDQFAMVAADDCERSEPIVLQLEHELFMIERLGDAHERHRVEGRKGGRAEVPRH